MKVSVRTWIREFRDDIQPASREPTHPLSPGLDELQLALMVRTRFYEDRTYARWRRKSWRRWASFTRVSTLALSAGATIFIGLSGADDTTLKQLGFVFSALVTTLAAVEPYFNWRSRWVMSEEALGRWHELEEALALYVASTAPDALDRDTILDFDRSRRAVWADFNQQWIEQRRTSMATSVPSSSD